mmetsp:Transcript_14408/g.22228  ORF Transcript_14408/g.22228 Transcript_14408/m.22228 type:complete len:268 (-) Transcript_14408:532-1335(-)
MVFGRSLTPQDRADDATKKATMDGLISAVCMGMASGVSVWYGLNNSASFRKMTNFQSRTAMIIMPPLFAFAMSSESNLLRYQRDMAEDATRIKDVTTKTYSNASALSEVNRVETEAQLSDLYKQHLRNKRSGIRIVEGDSLGPHHLLANFWQENPFKMLVALGLPSVAYIFHKYNNKQIPFQLKVMQTRIVGQFSVIAFLLGLVGFKSYMDANGKFVTEADAIRDIEDIKRMEFELTERLARERVMQRKMNEVLQEELKKGKSKKSS